MVMGYGTRLIVEGVIPLWAFILIIFGAASVLVILLIVVLYFFFFKKHNGTPDSYFYDRLFSLSKKIFGRKLKVTVTNNEQILDIEGPYLVIANHHSFLDFHAIHQIDRDRHYAFVMNRALFKMPVGGRIMRKCGFISKKMFEPDYGCVKNIIKTKEAGYPIIIFPEARLSTDGAYSYLDDKIASLCKALKIPVVLVRISGLYFVKPKWRKSVLKGPVNVDVKEVISPEDLDKLSNEEVEQKIESAILFNEFDNLNVNFKSKKKALGLENILYRCPFCGELYSNETKGNVITCNHCHKSFEIQNNYQFVENSSCRNIHDYYELIKDVERKQLDSFSLDFDVKVKILKDAKNKYVKERGHFHIDSQKVSFSSTKSNYYFEKPISQMEGIPYSVNSEFEFYHNGDLHFFYPPKADRKVCTRIALVFELLKEKERNNGTK